VPRRIACHCLAPLQIAIEESLVDLGIGLRWVKSAVLLLVVSNRCTVRSKSRCALIKGVLQLKEPYLLTPRSRVLLEKLTSLCS
jgi:hypothetical protein